MFLRRHERTKDGKPHRYWSVVETVRTPDGPRPRTVCYVGEWNAAAEARWLKTMEVFHEQGQSRPLKLFPSEVEPPENDPNVAQVVLSQVRLERARQFERELLEGNGEQVREDGEGKCVPTAGGEET